MKAPADVRFVARASATPGAEFLVLEAAPVLGMPLWVVVAQDSDLARAERTAGHHGAPVTAWLLLDPDMGWRRSIGHGWVAEPERAGAWTEAKAREIAKIESLQLRVRRADGRVTCPDVA